MRTEDGLAVHGAVISASTFLRWDPGENFGQGKYATATEKTDENGMAIVSMASLEGEIAYGVLDLPNFYHDRPRHFQFTKAALGRWGPWNPTLEIVLKKKSDPVPLYARKIEVWQGVIADALLTTNSVGFDLLKGDWLPPYGKGEVADFIFSLKQKLGDMTPDRIQIFDSEFVVGFSNKTDGIQSAYADPQGGSILRLPRMAPQDGYIPYLVRHISQNGRGRQGDLPRADQNYFFRVRTKRDDTGKIVSALYGKIHGEFEWGLRGQLGFTYYLNPTPDEHNLEFDPKRNLFKKLKSLEQVHDP
ncbi:MAG: hypothetical protein WCS70_09865 [Verrucomicrobiota bacterium]